MSADNQRMFMDGGRSTPNSRSSLGLNATGNDDHRILRQDSDLLETTADSDAVARASTQAIKSFEPIYTAKADASNVVVGDLKSDPNAKASGPMRNNIDHSIATSSAKRGESFLAFQEYVEQQRRLPKDRSSHAGIEQLNFRVPTAPHLFDPVHDTGENGVPDSVMQAYLHGDLMAIERFFEHIMRITAPSSIYEGEGSEDGDWTYGLEGPPPGFTTRKTAAKKDAPNTSREVPGMADTSASASHIVASSTKLQQRSAAAESGPDQTSPDAANHKTSVQSNHDVVAPADVLSVSRDHVGPDTSYSTNIVSDTHSSPHLIESSPPRKGESPLQGVHSANTPYVAEEAADLS
ncbi:hypothetical protein EV175_005519, partial [Coemansia sp. RSA 1933]